MRGHGTTEIADRARAQEDMKQEIQGRLPTGPYEFAQDLTFDDIVPESGDSSVVRRLKLAIRRDSRHSVASGRYLRIFGMSQAIRSIYDGGGQIQDGTPPSE